MYFVKIIKNTDYFRPFKFLGSDVPVKTFGAFNDRTRKIDK